MLLAMPVGGSGTQGPRIPWSANMASIRSGARFMLASISGRTPPQQPAHAEEGAEARTTVLVIRRLLIVLLALVDGEPFSGAGCVAALEFRRPLGTVEVRHFVPMNVSPWTSSWSVDNAKFREGSLEVGHPPQASPSCRGRTGP